MFEWIFKRASQALGFSMRAITIILTVCDTLPAITHLDIGKILIHNNNSVKNVLEYCSNGTVTFDTLVFPSYVNIPCPTSALSCNVDDWADRADDAIRPFVPDIDEFVYKIYILPKESCVFAGFGAVGPCDSERKCRIWINGHYAKYSIAFVHELGHNLGLGHASYGGNEYGDYSDVMGYCCIERCFNAANSNMLNITASQQTIRLPITSVHKFTLLSNEYVMIHDYSIKWFVQYRQSREFDNVPITFSNSINLYSSSYRFGTSTTLHAMLRIPGDEVLQDRFVVKLVQTNSNSAKIEISPP